ncbi:MAG: DEAD/DEAH box helicase family protein [Aquisalinus sp.]|nr:DEAD/DEAH box helicase family protein [Aquisalinus sp.]
MELKNYQQVALDTLRKFLEEARISGPTDAYKQVTGTPEQSRRLGQLAGEYAPLTDLPEVPYACLRLPTGGGKTILAAHAISVAKEAWLEKDFPLVLWLVPTNTIRQQTVEALKKTGHPYRQVLDDAFGGQVRVFDIQDFTTILPHDLASKLCVVVGTIQSLRVKNTEGRKVYAHHEMLENHFTHVSPGAPGLERQDDGPGKGDIRFSFANLLHVHRPLMIVDEAHNAMTGLTRDMQQRVNPAAVIEFTATPLSNANTIHSASALELKAEEMIKMPIRLEEHTAWEGAVTGAIHNRAALEEEAAKDADLIRPIVLYQATKKNEAVPVDLLKQHLLDVHNIPPEQIAVATGTQRELDDIDLFDPACPVRHVITVEALKEGWDCSFAYVFCSVANVRSAVAVEQLLGRVLRMPYAKARESAILNKAYAHVISGGFSGEAAKEVVEKLEGMGFTESEIADAVEIVQEDLNIGMFAPKRQGPHKRVALDISASLLTRVAEIAPTKIKLKADENGKAVLEISGLPSASEITQVSDMLPGKMAETFSEELAEYVTDNAALASPAEQGKPFRVGRLMTRIQGELEFAETDILMEYFDWSLEDCDVRFEAHEFGDQQVANAFEIYLNSTQVTYRTAQSQGGLDPTGGVTEWTPQQLVRNLDRLVCDPMIAQTDLHDWLAKVVNYLTVHRGIALADLMVLRFRLAKKIRERLAAYKMAQRENAHQMYLFSPEAEVEVSLEKGFEFRDGMFWDLPKHIPQKYQFSKHYLGPDNIVKFDGKGEQGDEFRCAQMIDQTAEVAYWIRNPSQHPDAFRLDLPKQKHYPDFMVKLKDDRILAVEYKGDMLADTGDSAAKRAIGQKWEDASKGSHLYLMIEKQKDGMTMQEQLLKKIQ